MNLGVTNSSSVMLLKIFRAYVLSFSISEKKSECMAPNIKNTSLFRSIKIFNLCVPEIMMIGCLVGQFWLRTEIFSSFWSFSQIQKKILDDMNLQLCTKNHNHPTLC